MKHVKRGMALLFALVLTFAMTITAFADNEQTAAKYTITINNETKNHVYEAYQIFTGDLSGDENLGLILSNIAWGTGVDIEKVSVTVGEADGAAVKSSDARAVAEYLSTVLSNSEKANAAAAEFGAALNGAAAISAVYSEAGKCYVIANLEAGYYLIKDKDNSLDDADDSYTLYIMQVVGNVTATPKADVPSVEKKVKDINDSDINPETGKAELTGWQDSADYDIGDEVPFLLAATLPSNLSDYKTYTVSFYDLLSKGLTFVDDSWKVEVVNGNDRTDVSDSFTYGAPVEGQEAMIFSCGNILVLKDASGNTLVNEDSRIEVTYRAVLNRDAVIGAAGNPNTVYLRFSNNPNGNGIGETPKDTVIVFTYTYVANKVDQNGNPLAGAEFTLEKLVPNGDNYDVIKTYEVAVTDGTTFSFKGIDDGTYRLRETVTPAGYNSIDDIIFTVSAEHEEISADPKLISLNVDAAGMTGNKDNGNVTTDIVNQRGSLLPSTGGAGTVILYTVGAMLALGACIFLVAKKRAGNE